MLHRVGIELQLTATEHLMTEDIGGYTRESSDTICLPHRVLEIIAKMPAEQSAARAIVQWATALLEA